MQGISKITSTNSDRAVKAKQRKTKSKANMVAMRAQTAVSLVTLPLNLAFIKGLTKESRALSKDQVDIVNKGAQSVVDTLTDLGKKGVEIINVDAKNLPKDVDSKMVKLREIANPIYATVSGKNAFFLNKISKLQKGEFEKFGIKNANKVYINKEKLSLSTFHELGHAFNFNCTKFWKGMQKSRTPAMMLSSLMALLPFITNKEVPKDGQELTKAQKIKNKVRNASPFVAALSMVPIVLEEGMASFRGNNWAKQVLDKPLAKKVMKTNAFGFATYVATAITLGITTMVAKNVKDKYMEKQANKN